MGRQLFRQSVNGVSLSKERELREIAGRMGCEIVKGISGAKGRDKRPGFDALCPRVHYLELPFRCRPCPTLGTRLGTSPGVSNP